MKKLIILLVILIPSIALLYFSLQRDPRTLPSTLVGKQAPGFELNTLDGKKLSLAMARGKPLILNFWSTWCSSCAAEHALLKRAFAELSPKGIIFYSVLYEDTVENAKSFLTEYGEGAPILLDEGLRTAIDYGVAGVPETFFIDAQGKILFKHAGTLTPQVIANFANEVLVTDGGKLP